MKGLREVNMLTAKVFFIIFIEGPGSIVVLNMIPSVQVQELEALAIFSSATSIASEQSLC